MSDDKQRNPFEDTSNPLEALAAASALGVTVATQAMGFWLSMLSGVTAAAREATAKTPAAEPARKPEPKAEAGKPRPAADVVPLKPKPVEEKPVAAKPAMEVAPAAEAPASTLAKAEPAQTEPVKAPELKVEAVEVKVAPAAPKAAAAPKKAAPKAAAKKAEPAPVAAPEATKPVAAPVGKLTPDLFSRPKAQDKPDQPDDLKLIKGIGPKLEVTLNGLGLWTFAQIAALEPAEVAWLDDYLGLSGRIVRDGWIEAAKAGGTNG